MDATTELVRPGGTLSRRQAGAALLITLALVAIIGGLALLWLISPGVTQAQRTQDSAKAMAMIRDALIARAARDENRPGSLPCPDINNDGLSLPVPDWSGSVCASYIGRVPWKTLDLPDLRDASGERFWYVLSPIFRDSLSAGPLNSDTTGSLTVTVPGAPPVTDVIAIIFAPGAPLPGQSRDPSITNIATELPQYLDGENSNGDSVYRAGPETAAFNDRALLITQDLLMPIVEQRVARQARRCLENFSASTKAVFPAGRYPFPAALADTTAYGDTISVSGPPYATTYYGRIPSTLVATNNALGGTSYAWPNDDPQPGGATTRCFASGTWWQHWRELLLYRVSDAYAPDGSGSCALDPCLTVNSQGNVKFVVIVAGKTLTAPNQSLRASIKNNASYYLEAAPSPPTFNNTALSGSGFFAKRPRMITTGPLGGFNDRLECASESGVTPCE